MATKSKKGLRLRKKRLHSVLNEPHWAHLVVSGYSLYTQDYSTEEVNSTFAKVKGTFANLKSTVGDNEEYQTPLWDWWTLLNKKRNRVTYVDFSFPYTSHQGLLESTADGALSSLRLKLSNNWAEEDSFEGFYYTPYYGQPHGVKLKEMKLRKNEEKYKRSYDYYYNNVDWERVLSTYVSELQYNATYVGPVQTRRLSADEWSVVVPASYFQHTFVKAFEDALQCYPFSPRFNVTHDKLVSEVLYKKYYK